MGQLITYATWFNARIVIWVAPEFRIEYVKALHRLNEWTGDGVKFYGIKVEAFRGKNDTDLEPRFSKVVYPGNWNKNLTLPPDPPMPERQRKYHEFFQHLLVDLAEEVSFDEPIIRFGYTGRLFRSRYDSRIGYAVYLEGKNDAWVTLHIETGDKEETKRIFDKLLNSREQIEQSVGAGPDPDWRWNRQNGKYFSSVNIRKDGSIDDSPEKLEMTRAWMCKHLISFRDTFDSRLEEMLSGPALVGRE